MNRYLIAACLALSACAGSAGSPTELTYLCDGGRMAAVTLSGDTARVRLVNGELELNRSRSASGTRYANPRAVLHIKDDEALLSIDGRELGPCQEVKPKS